MTAKWITDWRTTGQCFRCSSAPTEIQRKKSKVLGLDKNFALAHVCTKEQRQPCLKSGTVTHQDTRVTKDRPAVGWWTGAASLEGGQQADPKPKRKGCEEDTARPGRRDTWLHIKEQSNWGRKTGHMWALSATSEQTVSSYFQGVCVNIKCPGLQHPGKNNEFTVLLLGCHFPIVW